MKQCVTCEREFVPSSNHKKCSRCRDQERKHPCPGCGILIWRMSKTCIDCRPPHPQLKSPDNPLWRGASKRPKVVRGYIYVKAAGHPRGMKNSGWVFEHILVMEHVLGRYLLPGETVHHPNGVRNDNRPENLELWVRPQPTGCRVGDAVAWAREILRRYGNE